MKERLTDAEAFGEKLRFHRRRRGVSLRELAEAGGLANHTMLSRVENGWQRPSGRILSLYETVLRLKVDSYYGYVEPWPETDVDIYLRTNSGAIVGATCQFHTRTFGSHTAALQLILRADYRSLREENFLGLAGGSFTLDDGSDHIDPVESDEEDVPEDELQSAVTIRLSAIHGFAKVVDGFTWHPKRDLSQFELQLPRIGFDVGHVSLTITNQANWHETTLRTSLAADPIILPAAPGLESMRCADIVLNEDMTYTFAITNRMIEDDFLHRLQASIDGKPLPPTVEDVARINGKYYGWVQVDKDVWQNSQAEKVSLVELVGLMPHD